MAGDKGLETLLVWQKSLAFTIEVCKTILPKLPVQEKWSLVDQLRRSAQSIPANIAEGYGRFYFQESIRFCYIARGSLEETFSHLTLAQFERILHSTTSIPTCLIPNHLLPNYCSLSTYSQSPHYPI